jgi:hypothetical protein
MILQTIGSIILASECPLYNYEYQDGSGKAKSWFAFLFIPISQAMIDYGLVLISSLALRSLLPYHISTFTLASVFVVSFVSTLMMLAFKIAGPDYDGLISLLFPLAKFLPFFLSVRDSMESARQFHGHIITDRTEQTNQGKLITLYRLYATFL